MLKLARNLELPLDFVTERIAFLARTGAGKSGGMRVLAEEMLDAGQFIVFLDPKGDSWGVRSDYQVLIWGGEHGDVPLEPTAGKFVADFLVQERMSTVLDVSEFTEADMVRFVADFAERFYRTNREAVHWFIDESDEFAPQSGYNAAQTKCLGAIQRIQRRGRGRGIGVTVATQRSAVLNKSVLTQAGTLIAMQTTAPHDLKAVDAWLEFAAAKEARKEIMAELPTLKPREAYVYSPQFLGTEPKRITFRAFRSFDSMRTPKHGERRQQPKKLADINLDAVKRDMAATIEQAKANDPTELKKEIATLKRKINATPATVDEQATERAVAMAIAERDRHWEAEVAKIKRAHGKVVGRITKIHELSELNGEAELSAIATGPASQPMVHERRLLPQHEPQAVAGGLTVNRTQQRIIDALAWYESLGESSPSLTKVAAVALIDPTGGHFSNTVGPLSTHGLVKRADGRLSLTDAGRALAQPIEQARSLSEYHEILKARVRRMKSASNRTVEMLGVIIAAGGESLTTEKIGESLGINHTAGHFSNTIGPLSTAGLITRSGGVVWPTDVLFPEGLV